jgi:hypothetical protein
VKRLGLVKTIVVATSGRADAQLPAGTSSSDEPFTALGATLAIGDGAARTSDLRFESPNVLMRSTGSLRLDGSAIDLRGDVQLSEALTQQAGRDLVRYTQEQGRVTLPVTVTGSAAAPSVHVDVAAVAGRASKNGGALRGAAARQPAAGGWWNSARVSCRIGAETLSMLARTTTTVPSA